ncbi:OLC1v1020122C1 [Oldenlandia corymbosa var. corymbosa]|uniref:OLC1v1020122C1 n=1 Tax=Oldenlandia corymbosa var. corymbosa TaxID=529605 RepID=A0AAV1EFK0_OLDCO|nr:OLC1v1020122C1 [Oldenlandia corymbosa var. corymbosa]
MASESKEVETDLSPFIKVYKDGTVERIYNPPYVPPSLDPITNVSSKDITISSHVSARLYLPEITNPSSKKIPILVYFHGGGLCLDSAFASVHHSYLNLLVSKAKALTISVEYRLAPEHSLPAAYEDSWAALQWIASNFVEDSEIDGIKEPWLIKHGDFDKVYLGGDSAGGNIVHNMAMRAGVESLIGGVKIFGAFLSFPYLLDPKTQKGSDEETMFNKMWMLVYPSAPGGINNPFVNPFADDAPKLSEIGCQKVLVCTAEKDALRENSLHYVEELKKSDWNGEVELIDVEGENHCFHARQPDSEKARLYLPKITDPMISTNKLPILVYFHGGGFCLDSAFGSLQHSYLNLLISKANTIAISVEYRLAPEHPLPAAYEDCWVALQWVASNFVDDSGMDGKKEPWLINYGDFDKVYLGGDSAGGNIVHNMAMRAGVERLIGGVKIFALVLSFPHFCDSQTNEESREYKIWKLVNPSASAVGVNNPLINPFTADASDLSKIGCKKVFVCCGEKDELRNINLRYAEALKKSDWKGELELVDVEGEGHCFQVFDPNSEKAQSLITSIASFIKG